MALKEALVEIKQAYDLADYVSAAGIALKSAGPDKSKGLCPFHSERTPSFTVDDSFQNYRCFGCNAHGDLIAFVMAYEHLEFMDAVRKLAEEKSIELNLDNENAPRVDYKALKACLRETARFFQKEFLQLPEDHAAKKEITGRGLDPKKFRYGYAPEGRQKLYHHLSQLGYSDDIILEIGVCNYWEAGEKIFDFWQGRLMFFMTDTTGNPIGFSGRKLFETDKRGKYVNSPDTPVFDKSSTLFNHDAARVPAGKEQELFVVEGQFDVAALTEASLPNTIASSGTAFTSQQANMASRMVGADGRVVFCLDSDDAGVQAAVKVFKNAPVLHSMAYAVRFPDGMDPSDYFQEYGAEKLQTYIAEQQVPLVEYVLDALIGTVDFDSEVAKAKAVDRGAEVLKTVSSAPLRTAYLKKVALQTYSTVETVSAAVDKAKPISNSQKAVENSHDEITEQRYSVEVSVEKQDTEPELSAEDMVALLKKDAVYGAAARLIVLTLLEPKFRKVLYEVHTLFPKVLKNLAMELVEQTQDPETFKIIPEQFSHPWLVRVLADMGYFPAGGMMQSLQERQQQFIFIREEFRKALVQQRIDKIHAHYGNVLDSKGALTLEVYQSIVAEEQKRIETIEEQVNTVITPH